MIKMIKQVFALSCLKALFDNDELHSGPTKRGWEIINEEYNSSK
jgi:hypothetical protein